MEVISHAVDGFQPTPLYYIWANLFYQTSKHMANTYFEGLTFERTDFSEKGLPKGEYDHCSFVNCIFANTDLSGINFSECEFKGCNLSMAKLSKTAIRDVRFKACKLLGLHFEQCNKLLFSVDFEDCTLNFSSFYKLTIKKTRFKNCSLHEVDFTETDLTSSVFDNCDFNNAHFENTILEKVDLRTSYHYSIDPELNRVKKAKFSMAGIVGLLAKYDIEIE